MICFTLKCAQDHQFDSWFASSNAYEKLHAAGQVACPVCGDTQVEKSLMAPSVSTADKAPLSTPASPAEAALTEMRNTLEQNSENVGLRFAEEARAMHEGDRPQRQIHGEAKPEDAKALIDDGVPVLPLPFLPKSKAN